VNLLSRFYKYQDERFPLKYLGFTTVAVVLSSAAVLSYEVSAAQILSNYLACLFFLFHIRVIDESRDYEHDKIYHPYRPIHRGLISIKELLIFNFIGLILFTFCAFYFGKPSSIYGLLLLLFSFFAWKDFYLNKSFIKNHFYLYNCMQMSQMVLLQLFIYAVFTNEFILNDVMLIHLLFVVFNTIILEIVRKIKTEKEESSGNDTYSFHLGYKKSLYVFYLFNVLNIMTFLWMLYSLSPNLGWHLYSSLFLFILITWAVFMHLTTKSKKTELFLMGCSVLNYVGLNLLVYTFNI
tara:strand:- start:1407 stop:2288 length:882 start_codon:yes stop_codon:yes gene_type:complete